MNVRDYIRGIFLRGADPMFRAAGLAATPLRIMSAIIFIWYGFDKLFQNGSQTGMDADFFRGLGIPFPEFQVVAIGGLELIGGLGLLAGVLTKVWAFLLAGDMLVALLTSKAWLLEGPLLAMCLAILLLGAGPLSLDYVIGAARWPSRKIDATTEPAVTYNNR